MTTHVVHPFICLENKRAFFFVAPLAFITPNHFHSINSRGVCKLYAEYLTRAMGITVPIALVAIALCRCVAVLAKYYSAVN
jgi:hypothetical protein